MGRSHTAAAAAAVRACSGAGALRLGLASELEAALATTTERRNLEMGFYRSCANREEYTHFMLAHYFLHGALERALATQPEGSPAAKVWHLCPELRGAPRKLERDLRAAGVDGTSATPSPAAAASVASIEEAASDGASLLGHLYAHYLHLGNPVVGLAPRARAARLAVGLPEGRPEFYHLPVEADEDRRRYVEKFVRAVDIQGMRMGVAGWQRAAEGVEEAVAVTAALYAERPRLAVGAAIGAARVVRGFVAEKLVGAAAAAPNGQDILLPTARRVVTSC